VAIHAVFMLWSHHAILCKTKLVRCFASAGLFSTRGIQLSVASVASDGDRRLLRASRLHYGSERWVMIQQIANQLNKLVDVVRTADMTGGEHL